MVVPVTGMTSETSFQSSAGAGRAKMAIFDHPQEKEGEKHVEIVPAILADGISLWK